MLLVKIRQGMYIMQHHVNTWHALAKRNTRTNTLRYSILLGALRTQANFNYYIYCVDMF